MRLTRRGWGAIAAGGLLLGLGVLAARPVLLVGGAIVGAWLLAWQYQFIRGFERVVEAATVEQRPHRDRVAARRELPVSLSVQLPFDAPVVLAVQSRPPAGTSVREADGRRIELVGGGTSARSTYHARWPHAGRVTFAAPTVTARDPIGVFEATAAVGPTPTVVVEPRTPRRFHVGAGGETVAAYGEHAAGARGAGLEPVELRPYLPGDAADRIDWKATARLAEPHVREFEVETDRRWALVVDSRPAMAVGPPGETKLDAVREVALAILERARQLDDPLACVTVDTSGFSGRDAADADRRHYARVRAQLAALDPVGGRPDRRSRTAGRPAAIGPRLPPDDGSAFARTLRAFAGPADAVVLRAADDPLYEAVSAIHQRLRGSAWTVLLTDDADPTALRRTVELARRGTGRVLVYLTPDALFEPGGLGDLEAAYERYVAFEEHRKALARLDRVSAYEVARGDRLEAVLAAGRRRRGRPKEEA